MKKEIGQFPAPIEMIVKDPGLRQIYLSQVPDAYERLWEKHGVDEESRRKNRGKLVETISNPNLPQQIVKSILAIFEPKITRPSNP